MKLTSALVEVPASSYRKLSLRITRSECEEMLLAAAAVTRYEHIGPPLSVVLNFQGVGSLMAEVVVEDP